MDENRKRRERKERRRFCLDLKKYYGKFRQETNS